MEKHTKSHKVMLNNILLCGKRCHSYSFLREVHNGHKAYYSGTTTRLSIPAMVDLDPL